MLFLSIYTGLGLFHSYYTYQLNSQSMGRMKGSKRLTVWWVKKANSMEKTYGISLYNLFASRKLQLLESESITWLVLLCSSTYPFGLWIYCCSRRVTRGGRGGVSSALFQKLEKSALILGKNALILVIYGLNLWIKMKFLRVSRKKPEIFHCGAKFLSRAVHYCLSKCPNSKKTPLP